ncbi:MAG: hypothetical protein K6E95_08600 [Lachnospiraceae bacterium]|nr:hypothetical protein [Lachnospiraceae bacterium]
MRTIPPKKKKISLSSTVILVVFIICACLVVYYSMIRPSKEPEKSVTLFEEVTSRDLSKDYPQTPAEVAGVYCSIVKCMYTQDLTEDQLFTLCGQMRALYSRELLESNPLNDMLYRLEQEIDDYKEKEIEIASYVVEPAEDVEYTVVGNKKRANVEFHFTLKGKANTRLPEEVLLEEDEKREFKIIGWRAHEGK